MDADDSDARLGALMQCAQVGKTAAYDELLRLSVPIITRVVRPHYHTDVEIDNAVQDVLLAVHSVRHTYSPDRPFTPWLVSISRHRVKDTHRGGKFLKN
ncbi:MAG: hypothetical protein KGJ79_16050 [Alphaproteobacteria bacterium]|nr:hypothetical protein [Alphaproteobacteria bacterium]MDE2493017.1 hypothetical protein [Alphaproteobacteria bacterium]